MSLLKHLFVFESSGLAIFGVAGRLCPGLFRHPCHIVRGWSGGKANCHNSALSDSGKEEDLSVMPPQLDASASGGSSALRQSTNIRKVEASVEAIPKT